MLIWLRWFLTQHYDYLGEHEKALELVGSAIDHTPTVLELYMAKAKVLKHVGDLAEAAKVLDYARSLDTADRYINSKAVKYMLRAGEVDRAEELAGLFTREAGQSPMEQLTDMQCLWFMTEEAAVRSGPAGGRTAPVRVATMCRPVRVPPCRSPAGRRLSRPC